MVELWYKKLGFYANPLSIKPGMYDTDLIAYDLKQIFDKITKGELLFIEGNYGTGKTTILKNIISNYKGKNRIIYYSFNVADNSFDVNKLLEGAKTFVKKLVGLPERNIIFLLDEVHLMKTSEAKSLIKPYKDGIIKSIVFVSHDYDAVNFPEELNKLIKNNIIKTVELSNKEAINLVRKRLGNISIIDNKSIEKIFEISGKNPRRLLEYCEDVLKYTIEIGDNKITDYHINEVLKDAIKEQKKLLRKNKEEKEEKEKQKKEINSINETFDNEIKSFENKIEITEPVKEEIYTENKKTNESINEVEKLIEISKNSSTETKKFRKTKKEKTKKENKEKEQKEKKFKVNKLLPEANKSSLGAITENDDLKETEYKVYYLKE
ncbi:MAG: AAA family ATPase [Candidatus Woesearchaeota archaeon]